MVSSSVNSLDSKVARSSDANCETLISRRIYVLLFTTFNSPESFGVASCACLIAAIPSSLQAAVVHKYTFNNGNANDSVGTAHGTVIDNTGISNFAGGAINLSGNNGAGSGQDFSVATTVGAYVDLPNGVFTGAVNGGAFGQASLEIWFTVQGHNDWAEVYSFGTSDGGENMSTGGNDSDYVALIPRSGSGNNDFRATTKAATGMPEETPIIGSPTPLPLNQKQHVVLTFDFSIARPVPMVLPNFI